MYAGVPISVPARVTVQLDHRPDELDDGSSVCE
jgi:hypothetical protein